MSLQPVSAVSEQNLDNKSRVRPGSLEFVVMFRAPGGIWRVKRSLRTTPCVVKDSSCHIMQGGNLVRLLMEGNIEREKEKFVM